MGSWQPDPATRPRIAGLVAVASLALVAAVLGPAPSDDAQAQAVIDFTEWTRGDVHVHAAGDAKLGSDDADFANSICDDGDLDPATCGAVLVGLVADAATAGGLDWLILTEHVPFLGLEMPDASLLGRHCVRQLCIPLLAPEVDLDLWDGPQAIEAWDVLRDEAAATTAAGGTRLLLGQELGTAPPLAALDASALVSLLTAVPQAINTNGHMAIYSTEDVIENTAFDTGEETYLAKARDAGAWGGINHPDNLDEVGGLHAGSDWHCWAAGDRDVSGRPCEATALDGVRDGTVRAVEAVSGSHVATTDSLAEVDRILTLGGRLALVGGSDVHTEARAAFDSNGPLDSFAKEGNLDELGTRGLTYARTGELTDTATFDPTDPDDPVRTAIAGAETIASTGPIAVPTIDGAQPGEEAVISGSTATVTVTWPADQPRPDQARIVWGAVDPTCGPGPSPVPTPAGSTTTTTPAHARRCDPSSSAVEVPDDGERSFDVGIDLTATASWVRVELFYGTPTDADELPLGGSFEESVLASPIWVRSEPTVRDAANATYPVCGPDGTGVTLVDGEAASPLDDPYPWGASLTDDVAVQLDSDPGEELVVVLGCHSGMGSSVRTAAVLVDDGGTTIDVVEVRLVSSVSLLATGAITLVAGVGGSSADPDSEVAITLTPTPSGFVEERSEPRPR